MNTMKMSETTKTKTQFPRLTEKLDRLKADVGQRWKSLKDRVDTALDQMAMAFKKPAPIERDRPRRRGR